MKDYSELKKQVFTKICEVENVVYHSNSGVITTSNLMDFIPGVTKYRMRKILRELKEEGLIEYRSIGCPGEEDPYYHEWECDPAPPINGYALSEKGMETEIYKNVYQEWSDSFRKWAEE
jgi:DNA-binding HxlR family transcriptional regulator